VFETPLACIRSRSVSGAASRSGTRAPSAKGNAGSCFQTWTCGSMMRYSGGMNGLRAAPPSSARRVISNIDRLERLDHVAPAGLVAGARTLAGDVVVDDQPALEADRLQNAMRAAEVDLALAEVEDALAGEGIGRGVGGPLGVLVVGQHDARLVLLERLDYVAAGQVQVRGVGREVKELGVRHRHAPVDLIRILDDLAHVVVQPGAEAHLARGGADRVEGLAHVFERLGGGGVAPVGRKDHQVRRAELLEEVHRCPGGCDHVRALRRVVRLAVERDRDDLAAPLLGLLLHLRGRDVVGLENLRELRDPGSDEAGVAHHVQNVGERNAREVVPKIRAQTPFHVLVGREPGCGAPQGRGQERQRLSASHAVILHPRRRRVRINHMKRAASLIFAALALSAAEPPKSWIDPDTGHRIIRLTEEPGSASLYFNQNGYTADGKKMVYTTPQGISALDLKTLATKPVVAGRVRVIVTGHKTQNVYYTKGDAVFSTDVDTGATREIAKLPPRGSVATVNADETLLAGTYTEVAPTPQQAYNPNAPAAPQTLEQPRNKGQMMEQRLAARIPMALFLIDTRTGETKVIHRATDWLNHLEFSPTDPTLLMFCHEG